MVRHASALLLSLSLVLPLVLSGLVPGLPAGLAAADVLTTTDGLQLEGRVTKDAAGNYVVHAESGEVVLAPDQVTGVEAGAGPRARLAEKRAALAADDGAGYYRLALEAEAAGLVDVAREAYAVVVRLQPDHAAARRALGHEKVDGRWMSAAAAHRKRGLVLFEGGWMLPAEVEAAAQKAAREPAVRTPSDDARTRSVLRTWATAEAPLARAARTALADVPSDRRLRASLGTLYDRDPRVRAASARMLGEIGDESALRPLVFSAARDMDEDVRREAVLAAASFGHDDTAIPFIRALGSQNLRLVANAAQALADIGDPRALAFVVKRLTSHGGSARAFVSFVSQVSYVRDYDVEIAQASNIANPDVAVIQDGVVLDVRVIDAGYTKTWIEPLLVGAASQLAGREFASRDEVLAWYAEAGESLPEFPSKTPGRRKRQGQVIGAVEPR